MHTAIRKILLAILCGTIVAAAAIGMRFLSPADTAIYGVHASDIVAGLITALIALGIHLSYENQYYRFAMERAVVFSEVNHHVRNSIFPLCLAVQASGNADAVRISNEAVERINVVLREAITDVFSGKLDPVAAVAKKRSTAA